MNTASRCHPFRFCLAERHRGSSKKFGYSGLRDTAFLVQQVKEVTEEGI